MMFDCCSIIPPMSFILTPTTGIRRPTESASIDSMSGLSPLHHIVAEHHPTKEMVQSRPTAAWITSTDKYEVDGDSPDRSTNGSPNYVHVHGETKISFDSSVSLTSLLDGPFHAHRLNHSSSIRSGLGPLPPLTTIGSSTSSWVDKPYTSSGAQTVREIKRSVPTIGHLEERDGVGSMHWQSQSSKALRLDGIEENRPPGAASKMDASRSLFQKTLKRRTFMDLLDNEDLCSIIETERVNRHLHKTTGIIRLADIVSTPIEESSGGPVEERILDLNSSFSQKSPQDSETESIPL
jgi:hypothetical protein